MVVDADLGCVLGMVLAVKVDELFNARHKCPEILTLVCSIKSPGYESYPFVHIRNHNVDASIRVDTSVGR